MAIAGGPGRVVESETGFHVRCRVCGDSPSRWRVDVDFGRFEYFCERHEANKEMRLASLAPED